MLFLDEVDALDLNTQSVLLHAIETGRFYPLGSDHEVSSRFQVIAGANRDLRDLCARGRFRPDLLARLNMWSFRLPALRERREDIAANLAFELERSERDLGTRVGFNADAREMFLKFAADPATLWPGNFRDFSGSVRRLCTLSPSGRITRTMVSEEIQTLQRDWSASRTDADFKLVSDVLGAGADEVDPFDLVPARPGLAHLSELGQPERGGPRALCRVPGPAHNPQRCRPPAEIPAPLRSRLGRSPLTCAQRQLDRERGPPWPAP